MHNSIEVANFAAQAIATVQHIGIGAAIVVCATLFVIAFTSCKGR